MLVYSIRNHFNGTSGTELLPRNWVFWLMVTWAATLLVSLKGFGMKVYAYDAFCPAAIIENDGVKGSWFYWRVVLKNARWFLLHIPATPETKNSINFDLMSKMPRVLPIVNTARKEVVDEAGLVKMFEERPDFVYLTDIKPSNDAELAEKYGARYFGTPKRWVPRLLRPISMLVLQQLSRLLNSLQTEFASIR